MRKLLGLIIVLSLAAAACGEDDGAPAGESLLARAAAEGGISLPEPLEATPAYLVAPKSEATPESVAELERTPGVTTVVPASVTRMRVTGPEGTVVLRVAAVDALEYRSVAPEVTGEAEFVWTSLLSGESVLTYDAAEKLGIDGGGSIGLEGGRELEIGAFAENGTPNIADVVVDISIGQQLELSGRQVITVGAKPGTSVDALGTELTERMPDAELIPLLPPDLISNPGPRTGVSEQGNAEGGLIGTMNFKILDDGFIKPSQRWIETNIATTTVPIVGEVSCHRLLLPQLEAALAEIEAEGLSSLLRPDDYGGCYVPRFIDRNPELPLSMHAFGLAIDLNVSTNQLGSRGDMDARIVEIFERWGFIWGGSWSRPDPMHFELGRLIQSD
ncbi:MAG: M15 family metallopeptidase [Actinomycetota bacterium]